MVTAADALVLLTAPLEEARLLQRQEWLTCPSD